jgi:hypothetical protein
MDERFRPNLANNVKINAVKALCCKPEGRGFEKRWADESFPIYPIFPAELGTAVYSASNINEYQKKKIIFVGSTARPVFRADNLTAIYEPITYTARSPQRLTP